MYKKSVYGYYNVIYGINLLRIKMRREKLKRLTKKQLIPHRSQPFAEEAVVDNVAFVGLIQILIFR